MKFTLCAGQWEYWIKDKDTHQPLSCKQYIELIMENSKDINIEIPEELKNNKNAVIKVQRIR